jgi:hypothetical protein
MLILQSHAVVMLRYVAFKRTFLCLLSSTEICAVMLLWQLQYGDSKQNQQQAIGQATSSMLLTQWSRKFSRHPQLSPLYISFSSLEFTKVTFSIITSCLCHITSHADTHAYPSASTFIIGFMGMLC